jgi:toxin YoeB
MKISYTSRALEEYRFWRDSSPAMVKKIDALIEDIGHAPFNGLGKPEPLTGNLAGLWSRRITKEHRLVYRVTGKGKDRQLLIIQCRYHYDD